VRCWLINHQHAGFYTFEPQITSALKQHTERRKHSLHWLQQLATPSNARSTTLAMGWIVAVWLQAACCRTRPSTSIVGLLCELLQSTRSVKLLKSVETHQQPQHASSVLLHRPVALLCCGLLHCTPFEASHCTSILLPACASTYSLLPSSSFFLWWCR
jgi:hypothetical protein